ncbi:ABC transporter ATP-binding protein [Trinickia violacea]|uniref:ABC transporter ATP-binding protein n=1 Tax=Trinickia violacea TaxID=2571746 RepID=A0A4P8IS47_9BURK|nr:ABC transporter ATP-binding protein [Trinickia violacea]QCP51842.1 ABC transporter ATP-binding protein [Trinickia violacea]
MAASLKDVTKIYGDGDAAVAALRHASVDIVGNRFTVFSGPSGSGKTTALNLLGGIDRASYGSVAVAGEPLAEMSDNALSDFRARHIGFVFQSFNLLPALSAYENVEYPLTLLGVPKAERREAVLSLLDEVGVGDKAARLPGELSGGQQQRVAIARALVTQPALVLADEPTANLDSATGAAIINLMRRMQRERATSFVFSSHDPQVVASADDVVVIRDGLIVDVRRTSLTEVTTS